MDPFIQAGFILHNPDDSKFTQLDLIGRYRGFEIGAGNELSLFDGIDIDVVYVKAEDGTIWTIPNAEAWEDSCKGAIDEWYWQR